MDQDDIIHLNTEPQVKLELDPEIKNSIESPKAIKLDDERKSSNGSVSDIARVNSESKPIIILKKTQKSEINEEIKTIIEQDGDDKSFSNSQSASHYFSKQNIRDDEQNETKDKHIINEYKGLLMPTLSPTLRPNDIKRSRTKIDEDNEMIDLVTSLNQLSTSKQDLEKIDEELSKVIDSSSDETKKNKGKSKITNNLKSAIKNMSRKGLKTQKLAQSSEGSVDSKHISK